MEHDLSVLDYLSDFICCLYGKPGAYGVVTLPFSVREGINIFLAGFVPTENLRFRDDSFTFRVNDQMLILRAQCIHVFSLLLLTLIVLRLLRQRKKAVWTKGHILCIDTQP